MRRHLLSLRSLYTLTRLFVIILINKIDENTTNFKFDHWTYNAQKHFAFSCFYWIDLEYLNEKGKETDLRFPYEALELTESKALLNELEDCSLRSLATIPYSNKPKISQILRKKDLMISLS